MKYEITHTWQVQDDDKNDLEIATDIYRVNDWSKVGPRISDIMTYIDAPGYTIRIDVQRLAYDYEQGKYLPVTVN